MSTAKKCQWYQKGKRRQMFDNTPAVVLDEEWVAGGEVDFQDDQCMEADANVDLRYEDAGGDEFGDVLEDEEDYELIPLPDNIAIGEPGPGPSTLRSSFPSTSRIHVTSIGIDSSLDDRIFEEHPTAGKVIRMDIDLHRKWQALFGQDQDIDGDTVMEDNGKEANIFAPFASELDWRVAAWAVKDGIGHKSFDRLLAIPGVCTWFSVHHHSINTSPGQGKIGAHLP